MSGVVVDEHGPVAGAVVRVQATENNTSTDEQGRFTLTGLQPGEQVFITAWASGYFIVGVEASPGAEDVEIYLEAHANIDNPDYAWLPSTLHPPPWRGGESGLRRVPQQCWDGSCLQPPRRRMAVGRPFSIRQQPPFPDHVPRARCGGQPKSAHPLRNQPRLRHFPATARPEQTLLRSRLQARLSRNGWKLRRLPHPGGLGG
ncbi:MAG: carboxypeptidase regulatory-like domain-containing protein [Anaerolineales bacterium]|nr:carboxypeptidase regulatory-like domain-containing protein [Anaerolineales bacterium]